MVLRVNETWLQACEHSAILLVRVNFEFFSVTPFMFERLEFSFICFCLPLVVGQILALLLVFKAGGRRETFEM